MFELRSSVLIWIWTELAFTSHAKWSTVKLKITRVAPLILWKLDVTYIYLYIYIYITAMMAFLDVIVSFDSLPEKKTRVTLAISFRPLPKFLMSSSSMWRLADRAMEMLIFVFYNYFWRIFLISFFLMFSEYFNMLILKINLKNKKNYFNTFLR